MTASSPATLDLDAAQQQRLIQATLDLLARRAEARDRGPTFTPTDPALVDAMLAPPAEAGTAVDELMARLDRAAAGGWRKTHAGDLSFIPSGGLDSGAIAAWLAAGLNAFTGNAFESPALVALEESVLRWLSRVVGLPASAEGLLLSGGSSANQTAVVCARERGYEAPRSRAYLCQRAHHSLPKALHLAGIPPQAQRLVAGDAQGRLDVAALARQIDADCRAGAHPWLIVATAGSTDTGAVDDLPALAELAARHGAWLHVDAAYGGLFMLTGRGAAALRGLPRADSVSVDLHKGLMLPYGVGALLVRHAGALARAHAGRGDYLRDVPAEPGLPDYFERGPELTRPFRGLLAWLPLQLHGVAAFRAALDRSLDLARDAAQRLSALLGIELLAVPTLSVVAFRARAGDAATQSLLEAINGSGRLRVSSTLLAGRPWLRAAFLNPRSGAAQVDELVRIAAAATGR